MRITSVDCHVLLVPAVRPDHTDSAQDNLVVFIHTDEGITGVGESDANPWMLKVAIEAPSTHTMGMGLKEVSACVLGEVHASHAGRETRCVHARRRHACMLGQQLRVEIDEEVVCGGDHMEITWRSHGDYMEITWRSHGDRLGESRQCLVVVECHEDAVRCGDDEGGLRHLRRRRSAAANA